MADSNTYKQYPEITQLFSKACEHEIKAVNDLAAALDMAQPKFSSWKTEDQTAWINGVEPAFAEYAPGVALSPEDQRLLQALMNAGVDSPALRAHYALFFRELYPACQNPDGIAKAIGFQDPESSVLQVAKRMLIFSELKASNCCYDIAFGGGIIMAVDETLCEVSVRQERLRVVSMRQFLDSMTIIRNGSLLAKLIRRQEVAPFPSRAAFDEEAIKGIVTTGVISSELVQKILVPSVLSTTEFGTLISAGTKSAAAAPAAAAVAAGDAHRWDHSRSIIELEARLIATDKLEVENPDIANIKRLIEREAPRVDLAQRWANVIAILYKSGLFADELCELLKGLSANTASWKDHDLFVTVSDKMAGKLAPYWMGASRSIMGDDFLIETTIKMPFRLWATTEKLLDSNTRKTFVARVFKDFKENKPTPEHYVWLWKQPASEERTTFLSNSYMLFKTLHVDRKGSYLKSQRQILKNINEDDAFIKAVMNNGEPKAVKNLISCTKHLQLLDATERQALLVRIARIYPEFREDVAEHSAKTTVQRSSVRLTSMKSYANARRELTHLIEEVIPANTAAIEDARSRGDLSENSEYKYAKEQQRILNGKRNDLERALNAIRPTDFRDIEINDMVIPGTVVTLHFPHDGHTQEIILLGVMDGDSDRGFYSYDSPMGRVLMHRKVGEHLTAPDGESAVISAVTRLPEELLKELGKED